MAQASKPTIGEQRAERAYQATTKAIKKLRKNRKLINFNTVAAEANVSRRYLSTHPEFGPLVRKLRPQPEQPTPSEGPDDTGVVAVLRNKINHQQQQIEKLREEIAQLNDQLEIARGTIITLRRDRAQ